MLTSPVRSISDFTSIAGDIRLQLAQIRLAGAPPRPVTEVELEGFRSLRELLHLGTRFGQPAVGNLDVSGSSPEQIDLAKGLSSLIPWELKSERIATDGKTDVRKWTSEASRILEKIATDPRWDRLDAWEREFIDVELDPFLRALIEEPIQEIEE